MASGSTDGGGDGGGGSVSSTRGSSMTRGVSGLSSSSFSHGPAAESASPSSLMDVMPIIVLWGVFDFLQVLRCPNRRGLLCQYALVFVTSFRLFDIFDGYLDKTQRSKRG
jgi:hypothetical protein